MAAAFLRSLVMAPLWLAQLATGAKSRLDNPLIGSRRLNARGLHAGRVRLAAALAAWRRRRLAAQVRPEWLEQFARDGFVVVPEVVPPAEFPALAQAILTYRGEAREMQQGDAITRRMAIDPAMLAAIPALARLLARPDIVALFNYVASFRTTPLHYVQTIVSQVEADHADPQETAHADSFHSSLKAWLFLRDVSAEDGPFSYARGSHRLSPERLAWEHARSQVDPRSIDRLSARGSPRVGAAELAAMGLAPPEPMPLPANTLVVADMMGFHARTASARPCERVEIWSYARRNPFLPWLGGDLFSLPGLAERRVGAVWKLRDRLAGLLGQPWRPVGTRTPVTFDDPAS